MITSASKDFIKRYLNSKAEILNYINRGKAICIVADAIGKLYD